MNYQSGEGILEKTLFKIPYELHLPGGYQFCGPNTKLEERLKRGEKGINGLDSACKDHDIAYAQSDDLKYRHQADQILAKRAFKRFRASDANWKEKIAALGVAAAMKAKVKLGMGLSIKQKHCKIVLNRCEKELVKAKKSIENCLFAVSEQKTKLNRNKSETIKKKKKALAKTKKPNKRIKKKIQDVNEMLVDTVNENNEDDDTRDHPVNTRTPVKRKLNNVRNVGDKKKKVKLMIDDDGVRPKMTATRKRKLSVLKEDGDDDDDGGHISNKKIKMFDTINTLQRKRSYDNADYDDDDDFNKRLKTF